MNIDNAVFYELSRLKAKIDAGEELTKEEQEWANKVLAEVLELVQAFADALIEAFRPFVEQISELATKLAEQLQEMKVVPATGVMMSGYAPAITPLNPLGIVYMEHKSVSSQAGLASMGDQINQSRR